jgi:S1-C subfamily serine protease
VARIAPESPAFDAGLRIGDVITHVFGRQVGTLSQVDAATAGLRSDDEVELAIWRYDTDVNEPQTTRITLLGSVADGLRGIRLLQLDDSIADWLAVLGFTGRGVHIAGVELDKPARAAGLRFYDVITHVNDEPVTSVAQLRSLISSMLPGEVTRLRVWRYEPMLGEARSLTIEVRLDRLDLLRTTGTIPREDWIEGIKRLGISEMSTSTPRLADRYGIRYHAGVIVETVVEGSELDDELEPGSTIVAPRGVRITFIRPDGEQDQTIILLR